MESSTNSSIGSTHWLNTLLGRILHNGEYIVNNYDNPNLTKERLSLIGKTIYSATKELIDGKDLINQDNITKSDMHRILLINALKFLDNDTRLLLINDLKEKQMKKFRVKIRRIDEYIINIDENIWDEKALISYSQYMSDVSDLEDIVRLVAIDQMTLDMTTKNGVTVDIISDMDYNVKITKIDG